MKSIGWTILKLNNNNNNNNSLVGAYSARPNLPIREESLKAKWFNNWSLAWTGKLTERFPPSGKQFTFECSCSGIPIDFQTASVVSWVNKGRLTQWGTTLRSKIKTATGASYSHQELEDYVTFDSEPLKVSLPIVSKYYPSKISGKKWTRKKYNQVMEAFYTEVNTPAKCCTTTSSESRTHIQAWPWWKQACEYAIGQHQEQKAHWYGTIQGGQPGPRLRLSRQNWTGKH